MNTPNDERQASAGQVKRPVRPDCYEFGMDFMGDPEETEIRSYVEALERWADTAVAAERERWEVLAQHEGNTDRRQWASTGTWLYPGDKLVVVRA